MIIENYTKQATQGLFIVSRVDPITHCALGLTGEAGEIADLVKKSQYEPPREYLPLTMAAELGDTLWYLTNMAHLHNYTLDQIMYLNIHKLSLRHSGKGVYDPSKL